MRNARLEIRQYFDQIPIIQPFWDIRTSELVGWLKLRDHIQRCIDWDDWFDQLIGEEPGMVSLTDQRLIEQTSCIADLWSSDDFVRARKDIAPPPRNWWWWLDSIFQGHHPPENRPAGQTAFCLRDHSGAIQTRPLVRRYIYDIIDFQRLNDFLLPDLYRRLRHRQELAEIWQDLDAVEKSLVGHVDRVLLHNAEQVAPICIEARKSKAWGEIDTPAECWWFWLDRVASGELAPEPRPPWMDYVASERPAELRRQFGIYITGMVPDVNEEIAVDETISRNAHHRDYLHDHREDLHPLEADLIWHADRALLSAAALAARFWRQDDVNYYRRKERPALARWWYWLDMIADGEYPQTLLPERSIYPPKSYNI